MQATVEQHAGQGYGDDSFHCLPRWRVQSWDYLDSYGRARQDQRRHGELHAIGQPIRQHGDQPYRSRQDYQQGKWLRVGHDSAPPCRTRLSHYRPGFPVHHRSPAGAGQVGRVGMRHSPGAISWLLADR
jgi:hypothetical protein